MCVYREYSVFSGSPHLIKNSGLHPKPYPSVDLFALPAFASAFRNWVYMLIRRGGR